MAAAAELVEPRLPLHVFSSFLSAVTALCFAFRPPSPSLHLPCPAVHLAQYGWGGLPPLLSPPAPAALFDLRVASTDRPPGPIPGPSQMCPPTRM